MRSAPWTLMVVVSTLAACGCGEESTTSGDPAPATQRELLVGNWLLPGGGVGDRRYSFEEGGAFTLEVDSVGGTDTSSSAGTFALDDSSRLTLEYEQQGVALRPVETIFVSKDKLVIGGVLVAEGEPEAIVGTWHSWRVNETGGAISAATRTVQFGDGGVGSVTTLVERTTNSVAEEPQTSTASVRWAGEGPAYTLSGALDGTFTRDADVLVNLEGAFIRSD
jgi:hypothetical protein